MGVDATALSALEERSQTAHIRHGFNRINRVDQAFRCCASQNRRGETARLFDDLSARHRVTWRAAHSFHPFGESRSIGEFDVHDRDADGHEPLQILIFFLTPDPRVETFTLSQTFDTVPAPVLAASFDSDPARFAALPKRGTVGIAPPVAEG